MEKKFNEWESEWLTYLKDKLSVLAKTLDNNGFDLSIDDDTLEIVISDNKNNDDKILVLRTEDARILCNTLKRGVVDGRYDYDNELKDRICKTLKNIAKDNPEIHDTLQDSKDPKITEVFPFTKMRRNDMEPHTLDARYYFAEVSFYDGNSHAEISLSPTGTYGRPCVEVSMYGIKSSIELDIIIKNLGKIISTYTEDRFVWSLEIAKSQWDDYAESKDEHKMKTFAWRMEEIKQKIEEVRTQSEEEAEESSKYEIEAKQGDTYAQNHLGIMYYNGKEVGKNYVKAAEWFEKAAKQGDANGQRNLGLMYESGEGVPQDYVKAIQWYGKAAEQGLASAQNNLGFMYEKGYGVKIDYVKAIQWYEKAAEQDNYHSQLTLAKMYEEGKGITQDFIKAVKWYKKAAEHRIPLAQTRLKQFYEKDENGVQILDKAVEWSQKGIFVRSLDFYLETQATRKQLCEQLDKVISKVTSSALKKRLTETRDGYWERIEQLNKPDYTDEDEKNIKQENDRMEEHLREMEEIANGIPAKHTLYCNYSGLEFKEEIDASLIDISYEDDHDSYCDKLHLLVDKALIKKGIIKFLEEYYYYEPKIEPNGHFVYTDILKNVVKNRSNRSKVRIYLNDIAQDGSFINGEKIDITEVFKRNPDCYYDSNLTKQANEYISDSINKFVYKSRWQFIFQNDDYDYIDNLESPVHWPSPKEDGTWVDEDGDTWYPRIWFGLNDTSPEEPWILDGSDMSFWFNEGSDSGFIEYDNTDHVGCYRGYLPNMTVIRKKCPILLSTDDTAETIKEKTQKLFIERYQLVQEVPAKYVVYCDYPGAEFREELDLTYVDFSEKDEDESYREFVCGRLYDRIGDCLRDNLEKLLTSYFTEDDVPSSGHICFDEVRVDVFGNGGIWLNEDISVYIATVREDGTIIDAQEIDIEEYINLESEKERLMECGFWDETDDYIQTAIRNFVEDSDWHYALRNGDDEIEDIEKWPAPKEDGSWIDKDGNTLKPCMWFGNGYDEWVLDGDNLDFWLTGNPDGYVVEYNYDAFYGCYGGGIPDFDRIVKNCPIKISEKDTPESIKEKIKAFFIKQYRKVHKTKVK